MISALGRFPSLFSRWSVLFETTFSWLWFECQPSSAWTAANLAEFTYDMTVSYKVGQRLESSLFQTFVSKAAGGLIHTVVAWTTPVWDIRGGRGEKFTLWTRQVLHVPARHELAQAYGTHYDIKRHHRGPEVGRRRSGLRGGVDIIKDPHISWGFVTLPKYMKADVSKKCRLLRVDAHSGFIAL